MERKHRYFAVLLVMFTILIMTACKSGKVDKENNNKVDLKEYFNLTEHSDGEITYNAATDNEYAIVLNNEVLDDRIIKDNEGLYINIETVNDYIDSRFYYDSNEGKYLYTYPDKTVSISVGETSYTYSGNTHTYTSSILLKKDNGIYILLDYVKDNADMNYVTFNDEARRVVINTVFGEHTIVTMDGKNKIREYAGIDGKIMYQAADGEILILHDSETEDELNGDYERNTEETAAWHYVSSSNGISGYVKLDDNDIVSTENVVSPYTGYDYTHITKDFTICLGWHQIFSTNGNNNFSSVVKNAQSLNVISPTWMTIEGSDGSINSYASKAYVNSAHAKDIEVWALISDFDTDDEGNAYINKILPYTSSRTKLINNILAEVEASGADGINIDFERINKAVADDYIQFLWELSVDCRAKNLVLSVDNYVPTNGSSYYNRKAQGKAVDYVIIMGYDEHWSGCGEAGSVASIDFVENGIAATVKEVPADKVINAVPFYTRIWMETPESQTDGTQTIIEDPIYGNYALSSTAVSMQAALDALTTHGITKMWMDSVGQYYGEYKEDGIRYRIWLEEDKSISMKLDLMNKYGLAGMAAWKLGLEYSDLWNTISNYIK